MKTKVIASVSAGAIIAAACGGALWMGNQPETTYYPDGKIHTTVQRKFFQKTGKYTIYNVNGSISQQYNMVNGVKEGEADIFAGQNVIKVNYANGKLSGSVSFDTHEKYPELSKTEFSVNDGVLSVQQKKEDEIVSVGSKIICEDENLFAKVQSFAENGNLETFTALAECFDFSSASAEGKEYSCKYEGSFVYPKFTQNSSFSCEDKSGEMVNLYASLYGLENLGKFKISFSYDADKNQFSFKSADSNNKYEQTQIIKGLDEVIPAIGEFGFSKQENKDIVKLIKVVLSKITSSDSFMQVNGRKIFESTGDFNLIDGFSNQWKATFFGFDNKPGTELKITDKGTILNLAYPVSGKPLMSFGMKFNDKFKATYKKLLNNVLNEFSENTEDVAMEHLMQALPEYAMEISDVLDSVNGLLLNNKGEKIIGGVVGIKKGVDFSTFMESPEEAVTLKIITYKDNKVENVISGDLKNGFVANGKRIFENEIENYIDMNAIDATMKDIEKEMKQVKELIDSGKVTADPFTMGFYSGYFNAMDKYKENKVADQLNMLAQNIRTMYATQDDYSGLNSETAKKIGVVPEDMIGANNAIVHALGGTVNISSSQLNSVEEKQDAFIIRLTNLSESVCENMIFNSWDLMSDKSFVAFGVNTDLNKVYADKCENIPNVVCGSDFTGFPECMPSGNIVSYKFK